RVDTDSIAKYGSGEVKEIHSRWLSNINLAGAQKAATLIGRRFSDIQRKISFELDPKDSDGATGLWTGQSRNINHRDMTDFDGYPVDTMFQIISAHQSQSYKFSGIEFKYGDELSDDITVTDKIVYYSSDEETPLLNINLKEDWENLYQAHAADSKAIFIIQTGAVIGSSSNSTYSIETGSWTNLTTGSVTLVIQSGCFVVGKGGNGADSDNTPAAGDGGGALNLGVDLTIEGGGIIGGGGGGGGGNDGAYAEAAGGGGAGSSSGDGGGGSGIFGGDSLISLTEAEGGTVSAGGNGAAIVFTNGGELVYADGGNGGNLGEDGDLSGGSAGLAVKKNGHTLTNSGVTIIGAVL
ncbi:MAG: hypothetical protein GY814_17270, partial [Gammaproteobacteria bacterium]|nr:hypothetical protein [Gammaproteobacteria bacterium]